MVPVVLDEALPTIVVGPYIDIVWGTLDAPIFMILLLADELLPPNNANNPVPDVLFPYMLIVPVYAR